MERGIEGVDASNVSLYPIVSAYAREPAVVDEVNRLSRRGKGVNAGKVCPDLILDTGRGRRSNTLRSPMGDARRGR
jgi:hypothetical protein